MKKNNYLSLINGEEERAKEIMDIDQVVFSHESMEVRSLIEGYEKNTIITKVKHQRKFVWTEQQQSFFIATVLFNIIPIPPFQFYRNSKTELALKVTDSQQRLVTLHRFKAGYLRLELRGFPIKYITVDGKQYDIVRLLHGKSYDELNQKFKVMFNRRSLRVDIANNCPDSYSELFFVLYNTGIKQLKPHEIRLASMGSIVREQLAQIVEYSVFEHSKFSNMLKWYKGEYDVIAQVFMLMYHERPIDLTSYKVDSFINQFRLSGIPGKYEKRLHAAFEYMSRVAEIILDDEGTSSRFIEINKGNQIVSFLGKSNLVTVTYLADKALKSGVTEKQFAMFLNDFFMDLPEKYKMRLRANLNGLKSNQDRIECIEESFNRVTNPPIRLVQEAN